MSRTDLSQCQKAYEMRLTGMSYKKIGAALDPKVSEQRASEMFKTWQYHLEEEEARADLAAWRHSLYAEVRR